MSKPPTTAGQTCEPDYLLIPDKKGVCKLGMKRQQGAVQLQTDHQEGRLVTSPPSPCTGGGGWGIKGVEPPSIIISRSTTSVLHRPPLWQRGGSPYPPIRGEGELEADPPITADGRQRRAAAAAEPPPPPS